MIDKWLNQTHVGDCVDLMKMMVEDGVKVNCIVTSPPYWNLRDYGVEGQIGLEPTLNEWAIKMRAVFHVARDLLTDDGTLWLNLGDSYSSGGRGGNPTEGSSTITGGHANQLASKVSRSRERISGLPPKNLLGQPWRVAFALQDDGWYLRSDIIWHKLNPMPESTKDRPTKSHEYIFLLSKSEMYYYDADSIKEPASEATHARLAQNVQNQAGSLRANGGSNRPMKAGGRSNDQTSEFRNKRTVWTLPTEAFKDAHFAVYPPELITPCILAGCPPGGIVLDPFMGSGTTAMVATSLGRQFIGCELNPQYISMHAKRRTTTGFGF